MKRLYTLFFLIAVSFISAKPVKAQDYDVGVFYMPFWHNVWDSNTNTLPAYFWQNPQQQQMLANHHWGIIDDYDAYLVSKWKFNEVSIPKDIWYSGNINNLATLSPASWYNENLREITERQLDLMSDYEIDFVIYDWYWNYCQCGNPNYLTDPMDVGRWIPYWDGAQENWLEPGFNNHGMEMAIYWAAEFESLLFYDPNKGFGGNPDGAEGFFGSGQGLSKMIDELAKYMNLNGKYKTKEGKNVLYISYLHLEAMMQKVALVNHPFFSGHNQITQPALLQRMNIFLDHLDRELKIKTGKSTYFVAEVREPHKSWSDMFDLNGKKEDWMINDPITAGFDAITSYKYNYYWWDDLLNSDPLDVSPHIEDRYNASYNYNTMKSVYKDHYDYYMTKLPNGIEYHVPVTEGWNKASTWMRAAQNGDTDVYNESHLKTKSLAALAANDYKRHIYDNANSTPAQYQGALQEAKTTIDQNPTKTDRTVVLCCWNEHAEGTVIEPTMAWGYQYLQKVKDVFSAPPGPGGIGIEPPGDEELIGPGKANLQHGLLNQEVIPDKLIIGQNYPNPFRDETTLTYGLPSEGHVSIKVYSSTNQLIATLVNEHQAAGVHKTKWKARSVQSGVYFCLLSQNGITVTKKMIVID